MILALMMAAESPCAAASLVSGVEQRACVGRLGERIERDLTAQWRVTLSAVRREDARHRRERANVPVMAVNLLASQRAWLRYRDVQCAMVSDQFAGGTGYGEFDNRCRIQLTRQRIVDLRRRADAGLIPPFP